MEYRPGKCLLRYSRTKKNPFQAIKTRSSKSRKIDIFAWFWSKNGPFSNFYCLCNIGQENVFYDILERINPFLGHKNKKFKKSKNGHFSKGVNPWFCLKDGPFSTFFVWAIYARKMSFAIFQNKKTPFQAIKTRSSKRRKSDIFPKGLTHSFRPKLAIFPIFFLGNRSQENVFYDILERKKAFLGYKKKKFEKSKN